MKRLAPIGLALLLAAGLAAHVSAYASTDEAALRASLLSCAIVREAHLRGIPDRRIPTTVASCRALR